MNLFDKVISLGGCCEVTFVKKLLQKESELSPFDWIACYTFTDFISLINSKFRLIPEKRPSKYLSNQSCLHIGDTDALIPHLHPGMSENDEIEVLQKRYDRMIRYLETTTDTVLFIRKNHIDFNFTSDNVDCILSWIRSINPNLRFTLLLVEEFEKEYYVFNIPNVIHKPIRIEEVMFDNIKYIYKCSLDVNGKKWWSELTLE